MNLLLVSIAFPPKNDPECIQTARYFKYLSRDPAWNIDVVTSATPTLFMPYDAELKRYDQGYRQKIEIRLRESKLLNFAVRKIGLNSLLFPDSKMTFHWQWRNVIRELKEKPDVIYSRSNPMSSAFMAMKLKGHFKVPWVMHMSDPWALSPLESFTGSKKLQEEANLLGEADKVVFTSSQTRAVYVDRYHRFADKFSVLPNVYDPEDIRPVSRMDLNKLRIVYTGGLAGNRNVNFLNRVLSVAATKYPRVNDFIEFIFAGDRDRPNRNFFDHAQGSLQHRGLLSHFEARLLCESAHILLVVDNPTSPQGAIFFPSKLLDYFTAGRKIWAVSPEGSVTREILKGTNHAAFDHGEIEKMADFLLESVNQFKRKEIEGFRSDNVPQAYDAEINAEALSRLLGASIH